MNYYEKIIQEKMNSTQVIEKGTIKGAEYFIEKVTETVKYPRPFEQVRYIGKLKKDGRVIIYTPRHENLDTCKRALEKLVDENKSMFNNSKGETDMGYYADLIKQKQEKRNSAESHLKGLIGKKFKRDTDLERAVNSSIYTEISDWSHPRMVVFDKYTDEKYILTTEDNNQYGKDQEFWISKVQKVNSKEEKDNAKPFYTLQGRELKTRSEVERYISDLEKEEREYFSYLRSYERKLEEAKNEPKPHSIGWADRISKYTDQIKSYKRSIERTDNWKSKAKEWISQNRNSKEEKDNDSEGRLMEIAEKVLREYPESTKSYAKFEDRFLTKAGWGYNPSKVKVIKEIWERVANSKEEKDNEDSEYVKAIQKAERIINRMFQSRDKKEAKSFLEKIGWSVSTLGESPEDYARAIRRAVKNYPEKSLKILSNSKEEKDNASEEYIRKMYAEIQELKRKGVKDIDKYYAAINQYKEAEEQMKRYKETGKSYYKTAADNLKREADQWMREIKASIHNEKEEKGYYAKLVEEKNANPYYVALSLIKDKHSVNDIVRELTSNYGVSKSEALHAIEKAAKDSHEAEIERKVRELY